MNKVSVNETAQQFAQNYDIFAAIDNDIINRALAILKTRMRSVGVVMSAPNDVKQYLTLKCAELEHEIFGVLFLDVKNKLIADEVLFNGTLTHTSVYPRELIKAALKHNAAAIILYHNHPSGECAPSVSDRGLTKILKEVLGYVDVRINDHIIVAALGIYSFTEHGEI